MSDKTSPQNITTAHIQTEYCIEDLAVLVKMDRRTVSSKLKAAKVPYKRGKQNSKIYESHVALLAIYKTTQSMSETNEVENEKLKMQTAKRQLAELELAEKLRNVIPIEEILEVVQSEYSIVRAKLLQLPSSLAKQLTVVSDAKEISKILSDKVNEILAELQADSESELEATPVESGDQGES